MSEATDLIVLPPKESALVVFSAPSGLEPYLEKIRAEVSAFVPDVSTRKGRDAIKSLAHKITRSKTALDSVGKELVAELKDVPKKIDAERKRVRDALDALRDEARRPLDEWEAKEAAREQAHMDGIVRMQVMAAGLDAADSSALAERIAEVEQVAIGPQWEEFEAEAARTKDATLAALRPALEKRRQYEAEQAELARLREEQAAREQQEREQRIAREAAERAQREAEQRAQDERDATAKREADAKAEAERRELELKLQAERAEREKLEAQQRAEQAERDAEERARQAAEQERQRIADEQRREAEAARQREADTKHRASINRAALAAFIAHGFTEDQARKAITLIAKQQIPHISISY